MQRSTVSDKFPLGSQLPQFELLNVDGRRCGSKDLAGAPAALVVFSCNHCPYVKGSDQRLIEIVRQYEGKGLRTIAINSNDPIQYPEDSFDEMKKKAKNLALPFPYLFDETQQVAKLFDAACTPEVYLFNAEGKLAFHGTINDNPRNREQARAEYLPKAIDQVLSGKSADPAFVHPLGCSIKWKLGER